MPPRLVLAERQGFRLMLIGRSVALGLFLAILLDGYRRYGQLTTAALTAAMIVVGLAVLATLGTRFERRWHRYALVTLDVSAVVLANLLIPMTAGGEVPRVFIFRANGMFDAIVLVAVAALSLMPGLVLYTGIALAIGNLLLTYLVWAEMDRVVSWSDLPANSTPEQYMALLLDPDFLGFGNRMIETYAFLLSAGLTAYAVKRARAVVIAHGEEAEARARAERSFSQFVPAEVAQELLRSSALRPAVETATVLHLDVAGFTGFASSRAPAAVLAALDALMGRVALRVNEAGGVVLGFAGDAMLASFGLPRPLAAPAGQAIAAARAILDSVAHERFAGSRFEVRIGLGTGPVAGGTIGGTARRSYTVYGETVNMAQRLEEACKQHGTALLLCEETWRAAGRPAGFEPVGPVAIRGAGRSVGALRLA